MQISLNTTSHVMIEITFHKIPCNKSYVGFTTHLEKRINRHKYNRKEIATLKCIYVNHLTHI